MNFQLYGKDANLEDNYRSYRILNELGLFFNHFGFINFGPYSTLSSLRQNIHFLWETQLFYRYSNIESTLILTPGAAIYDNMKSEGRVLPRKHFWEISGYEFGDPFVLKLAQHYKYLRTIYPHIDLGGPWGAYRGEYCHPSKKQDE